MRGSATIVVLSEAGKPIFVRGGRRRMKREIPRNGTTGAGGEVDDNTDAPNCSRIGPPKQDEKEELRDEYLRPPQNVDKSDGWKEHHQEESLIDDPRLLQLCGMVQALLAATRTDKALFAVDGNSPYGSEGDDGEGQELRSIRTTDGLLVVFMSAGALTLVAMEYDDDDGYDEEGVATTTTTTTELYLRMQLEYVYGQVVFTLTDHVQSIFRRNANFDLRNMLGPTDGDVVRGMLGGADTLVAVLDDDDNGGFGQGEDEVTSSSSATGCFFTASVEPFYPLDPHVRHRTSHVLHSVGQMIPNTLFAILCHPPPAGGGTSTNNNNRLVSLVQPSSPMEWRLSTSDLRLLLNLIQYQPGLLDHGEAWVPLCLPRLNPGGFVYAYVHCIDRRSSGSIRAASGTVVEDAAGTGVGAAGAPPTVGAASMDEKETAKATTMDYQDKPMMGKKDIRSSSLPHAQGGLTLILISTVNTTEQFEWFRRGCVQICADMGIPAPASPRAASAHAAKDVPDPGSKVVQQQDLRRRSSDRVDEESGGVLVSSNTSTSSLSTTSGGALLASHVAEDDSEGSSILVRPESGANFGAGPGGSTINAAGTGECEGQADRNGDMIFNSARPSADSDVAGRTEKELAAAARVRHLADAMEEQVEREEDADDVTSDGYDGGLNTSAVMVQVEDGRDGSGNDVSTTKETGERNKANTISAPIRKNTSTGVSYGPSTTPSPSASSSVSSPPSLADAILRASDPTLRQRLLDEYCHWSSTLHFVLRCDVPLVVPEGSSSSSITSSASSSADDGVGGGGRGGGVGHLSQCIASNIQFPLNLDPRAMSEAWRVYQRLALRLRHGSATSDSIWAHLEGAMTDEAMRASSADAVMGRPSDRATSTPISDTAREQQSTSSLLASSSSLAQGVMESLPHMYGVTYYTEGTELYVGLNGQGFEFYATLCSTVGPRGGTTQCARLVRRLLGDRSRLFLDAPLTWGI